MNAGIISSRYARALMMFGKKTGSENKLFEEAVMLTENFSIFPNIERALSNPSLSRKTKQALINTAAGGNISRAFERFTDLLFQNHREAYIRNICLVYIDLYFTEKKLSKANLETAIPIDDSLKRQILDVLEKLTKQKIDLHSTVNPEIIGGYVLRWDTYRLNGSVASGLKKIKKELSGE